MTEGHPEDENNTPQNSNKLSRQSKTDKLITTDLSKICGRLESEIASGTYGKVYRTSCNNYAVKRVKSETVDENLVRETGILTYLNHPNIINLVGMHLEFYFQGDKSPVFVMPIATTTLDKFDSTSKLYLYSDLYLRKIIYYQLLRAVAYCHDHKIWHLDIKPSNVLVFENYDSLIAVTEGYLELEVNPVIKLADFGIAHPYCRPNKSNNINVGTLYWRAPEILLGDNLYTEKVDIWSVGVMLFDEIAKKKKYYFVAEDESNMMEKIYFMLGTPDENTWANVTKLPDYNSYKFSKTYETGALVNKIVSQNQYEIDLVKSMVTWPNQRINAREAISHKYFDQVSKLIEGDLKSQPINENRKYSSWLDAMTELQHPLVNLKNNHPDINNKMRKILYEWLYDVMSKFKLRSETLLYGFALLDYYLEQSQDLKRHRLQLYGISAIVIAGFMLERPTNVPELRDYRYICDYAYTVDEIKKAVNEMLTAVDFNIVIATTAEYIQNYLEFNLTDYDHDGLLVLILMAIITKYPEKKVSEQAQMATKYLKTIDEKLVINQAIDGNLGFQEGEFIEGEFLEYIKQPFGSNHLNSKLRRLREEII